MVDAWNTPALSSGQMSPEVLRLTDCQLAVAEISRLAVAVQLQLLLHP